MVDLTQLDNSENGTTEHKRRKVTDKFKQEKKKTVTSISLPTPLFHAIDEYCEKVGISKAAFFTQIARERLKNEELKNY